MLGGNCTMWFDSSNIAPKKRSPFGADLFGSVCYTFQHGKFKELYGDLTRVDARLDICSASAFAKRLINGIRRSSVNSAEDPMSSPRLNLIFQQQVFLFVSYICLIFLSFLEQTVCTSKMNMIFHMI